MLEIATRGWSRYCPAPGSRSCLRPRPGKRSAVCARHLDSLPLGVSLASDLARLSRALPVGGSRRAQRPIILTTWNWVVYPVGGKAPELHSLEPSEGRGGHLKPGRGWRTIASTHQADHPGPHSQSVMPTERCFRLVCSTCVPLHWRYPRKAPVLPARFPTLRAPRGRGLRDLSLG